MYLYYVYGNENILNSLNSAGGERGWTTTETWAAEAHKDAGGRSPSWTVLGWPGGLEAPTTAR